MSSYSQVLVEKGLVSLEDIDAAQRMCEEQGLRLDQALIQSGAITERAFLEVMGERLDFDVIDLPAVTIETDAIQTLPSRFVYRNHLAPIARENGTLKVATSDPFNLYVFDEIKLLTGLEVRPVLAPRAEIGKVIKDHYGVGGDTIEEMAGEDNLSFAGSDDDSQDLLQMAQEASVIKLVNEIILEAINERASDIHIEPFERTLSIRYRIDGVLQEAAVPPQINQFKAAIISRVKILSNMNIAERRLPQDGRIKFSVGSRQVDVRVSVIPMIFGEGVVMRILDKATVLYSLPELGLDEETFAQFQTLIKKPHGILLVTGPTGSGKTTTLYAALNAIVGTEKKVITTEDPVEYNLDGVNQIPVDHKVGMSFAVGLRSILRHDPDVVMIGEIRDLETAQAATQASLTGHLVLSTLHTNDAASAATRLIDMGVEPFLVSSTLSGVMAQRLVRVICPDCKTEKDPGEAKLPKTANFSKGDKLFHGSGCRQCRKSGYRGRTGLYELLMMNEELGEKIIQRVASSELVQIGRANGMRLLSEDGWGKVKQGITTLDEVMRVTAE
ncbi:MAG: type II secretion system ATPase GspE [Verrucomicrobiota bacterium]|jgi:general secretion pathway protein E/type IV pilus assembly protein PilB|nr:type II secretion system ATPase GspE [Verrucomicrobiota bacterium]MDP7291123.1 type II secretion system ATPase GspE [Verrucomicrobiota bacterium]|tara:strand:+ start:2285 stop:3955 length:1671 start_codon:yes stop_codon:yes gene_type:complete